MVHYSLTLIRTLPRNGHYSRPIQQIQKKLSVYELITHNTCNTWDLGRGFHSLNILYFERFGSCPNFLHFSGSKPYMLRYKTVFNDDNINYKRFCDITFVFAWYQQSFRPRSKLSALVLLWLNIGCLLKWKNQKKIFVKKPLSKNSYLMLHNIRQNNRQPGVIFPSKHITKLCTEMFHIISF